MKISSDLKNVGSAAGGALLAGVALKKVSHPIMSLALLAGGAYLSTKGKNATIKALGNGMAGVGAIGVVSKVAEKVTALQKFAPGINGMGELIEDEDGNVYQIDGLTGTPQLVQDEFGNSYMVNGVNGEDLNTLIGYDDEEEYLEGIGELQELV